MQTPPTLISIREIPAMNIYHNIYYNLCESRKQLKYKWVKDSGLHRHHIIPVHSGGTDDEVNFTYLTIREHIIAHFLLWKMNNNPNDLRSMKMLGANITPTQRKIIGEYCRDNNIGFFGASKEQKFLWRKKSHQPIYSTINIFWFRKGRRIIL